MASSSRRIVQLPASNLKPLQSFGLPFLPTLCALLLSACSESPTSPNELSRLDLGAAYDVHVVDGIAFVSTNQGIAVVDVEDMTNPRRIGQISESSAGGPVAGFGVFGDTLLAFGDRFSLYSIHGGGEVRLLASYSGRDFISGGWIEGKYAYLAYLHGGLEVVDFQDPTHPVSAGYAASSGQVNDLALADGFAYVANSSVGLEVFDVIDPSSPAREGVVEGTGGAWDIHIQGDLLFLGCHRYGVKVIDRSQPSEPSVLGAFNNGGEIYGVHAVGTRLYTGDLQQGVEVLDVSLPESPRIIVSAGGYHPHDLYSDGRFLFLADQDRHFVVLPLDLEG